METVEIIRNPLPKRDSYGAVVTPDPAPTPVRVEGCRIAPTASEELPGAAREGSVDRYRLYAPPGTDVRHTDQIVRANGSTFEVAAPPAVWPTQWGISPGGVVVDLVRIEG